MCHLSQGAHTPYTRGIPWVTSAERVRLTGGRACWRERGHSYRSISSYRKLPPPACPGTTCTNERLTWHPKESMAFSEFSEGVQLPVPLEYTTTTNAPTENVAGAAGMFVLLSACRDRSSHSYCSVPGNRMIRM